jgi:hypothetical protein
VLWIVWATGQRDVPTGIMFAVYLAITVLGLARWHGRRSATSVADKEGTANHGRQ